MQQTGTPDSIMRVATGFMASKHLFVATEIGLFEQIADEGSTLDELSARTHVPRRTLRMVADAMVALGFLDRRGDRYVNGADAATFLAGRSTMDLRPMMRFWNRVGYLRWSKLEDAIRTDGGTVSGYHGDFSPEEQQLFSAGVESVTARAAESLAGAYDFSRHRNLIDLGGGTGSFLIHILARHPDLRGTLLELPIVTEIARRRIASSAVASRIEIREGDFLNDPIPRGFDAAILANIIHLHPPEKNVSLLRSARDAMERGARLLIVDFWMNATHSEPTFAALMSGEFLLSSGIGDVYSRDEGVQWLERTGWRVVDQLALGGPSSALVAEAT